MFPKLNSFKLYPILGNSNWHLNSLVILGFNKTCCRKFSFSRQCHNQLLVQSMLKVPKRNCSYDKPPLKHVPNLTDFPVIYWPNILKYIKNKVLSGLIISKYFDKQFLLPQFVTASIQAVAVVSDIISRGSLDELEELVSPDVINEIKLNLLKFNYQQSTDLKVYPEDIYFSFPYEVGILYPDKNDNKKRYVEITMCYHVFYGYKELMKKPEFSMKDINLEDKLLILNYRFLRNYSEGIAPSESYWIINGLNHSKPIFKNKF